MFKNLFNRKPIQEDEFIVASLNARLQPLDRGHWFEDALDKELKTTGIAEVSGGGTMMSKEGEIEFCDIEIQVKGSSSEVISRIIEELEKLGAPKGSTLRIETDGSTISFGVSEGMAIYLNGTDLPQSTYETTDVDFVIAEIDRLLQDDGKYMSFWQGPTETALYVYGSSFEKMKGLLSDFIASYPLCEKARIEQIA